MNKNIIILVVIILVIGAGIFFTRDNGAYEGIHMMSDGTVMLGNGEVLEGAHMMEDGSVMLENGEKLNGVNLLENDDESDHGHTPGTSDDHAHN